MKQTKTTRNNRRIFDEGRNTLDMLYINAMITILDEVIKNLTPLIGANLDMVKYADTDNSSNKKIKKYNLDLLRINLYIENNEKLKEERNFYLRSKYHEMLRVIDQIDADVLNWLRNETREYHICGGNLHCTEVFSPF